MFLLLVLINTQAQTGLNFQGVARNSNNIILASQQISLRLSILQGSASGVVEYTETRKVTTNAQGLFAAVIGESGAINTLGNFTTINWKNTPKYLKIEMDVTAGINFVTIGTTQFQSVAYAQFANSVDAANIAGIVPVEKGGTGLTSITELKSALAINKISIGLPNVDNTTDLLKPISTATQTALNLKANTIDLSTYATNTALVLKANTLDVTTSLSLKENTINKSSAIDLGGMSPSDVLYPTQKAVKEYISANSASGNILDGGIGTIKLADGAVTNDKLANGISKSKIGLGNIDNTSDALKPISTAAQTALDLKANSTDVTASLLLKENGLNKSTANDLGGVAPSDILFPTQKAVKEYIATYSVSGSKVVGNISGNAATVTTNANLTGVVTSLGNITSIASGTISNSMLANSAVANLSGTNTGDNAVNSNYSSLISNATHTGDVTGSTALTVVKINGTSLAGLGTGILKNTTGTGVPSIAVASDFPILNQSTSGNAATATKLTTSRSINGVAFNGTADITIAAAANAETLAGNNINATITGSSLTSVGILNNATINGKVIVGASSAASASAVLEASSTTQGFLPPRMTLEQRIAITSPAQGLMIYCTNCGANGEPEYFNGSSWLTFGGNATAKVIPTVNITVGTYTYTGSTQGPSAATNTGTGSTYTFSYTGTGSTTYVASSTKPINAGTYSATASLSASLDGNYAASSSSAVFTIAKAIPTVNITVGTYTYTANTPQGPSASTNTGTGTLYTYSYAGTGFTTYGPSSTKPTDGGTYTVIGTVAASSNGNYAAASSCPTAFKIALNLSLGNSYGGGTVAYILKSEDIGYDPLQQHGLIISGNLIVSNIIWGANGSSIGAIGGFDYVTTTPSGGVSIFMELGAGINNTNLIIAAEGPGTTYAAGLAKAYLGGEYTNWYLPSFSELYGISVKGLNLGAPTHNYHWTSTEGYTGNALVVTLGSGNLNEQEKVTAQAGVRAVRVF